MARYFAGSSLVIRALRPIAAGEEVPDNYGPTFYFKSRSDRAKELSSRYWFDCGCVPCRQDWPLLAQLPNNREDGHSEAMAEAKTLMDEGRPDLAVEPLCRHLNQCYVARKCTDAMRPSEDLIRAEDKLRVCVANLGTVVFAKNNS